MKPPGYLIIYSDQGPRGPCGQSSNITCNHTYTYLFDSREQAREKIQNMSIGRKGSRARIIEISSEEFEYGGPCRWIDFRN